MFRSAFAFTIAFVLVACSSGAVPTTQQPFSTSSAHRGKGRLTLRVRIPKRKHHRARGARYLSPATQGMTLAITGPTNVTQTLGLTIASNPAGCSSSLTGTFCTLTVPGLAACPTSANCYDATIATYDAISCTSGTCTIPGSAKALSKNQNVGFTVATAQSNSIAITLDGIPASAILVPDASSSLTGSASSGYSASKCLTTPQNVSVYGVDADDNIILGAGAPSVALASNDTTHLAVATPAPSSPNRFALTPPATLVAATIPNPNTIVQLTATVTPLAGSGATAKTDVVDVTFNTDICGVFTVFSTGVNTGPEGIVEGPDDNLWFTDVGKSTVGKMTTTGTVTEYTGLTGQRPEVITVGSDGNLWFTESMNEEIGKITTMGSVTEYSTGMSSNAEPYGIASGADGALWFTEYNAGRIGTIATSGGAITEYSTNLAGNSRPQGLALGPDGALWFAQDYSGAIGSVTTAGTISNYSSGVTLGVSPQYIAAGPDGAMWFTSDSISEIGRVALDGTITQYPLSVPADLGGIAAGPDGALWFTDFGNNAIWRITTTGTMSEFTTGLNDSPQQITSGPGGALWFTADSSIVRMQ